MSEAIKRSAAKVDAYVLDPVAEGWYEGVDLDPLLYTDRVHLNSEGGDYVADKIIEGMRRVGVPIDSAPGQGDR